MASLLASKVAGENLRGPVVVIGDGEGFSDMMLPLSDILLTLDFLLILAGVAEIDC